MILDAITKSLEIVLAGAVTANQLQVVSSWADITTTAFTPGETDAQSNNTTAVTIVAAPAASTQRQIKEIIVFNKDTAAAIVKIQLNNNTVIRQLIQTTLQTLESLIYREGMGWMVLNINGSIKATAVQSSFQKCRMYRAAAQSIPQGTFTKIGLDTDSYDPYNISDTANNRIMPTTPGYYQINGQTAISLSGEICGVFCCIFKNGTEVSRGTRQPDVNVISVYNCMVSDLIYLNGVNDYVELDIYHSSSAARDLETMLSNNYLSLVGPF